MSQIYRYQVAYDGRAITSNFSSAPQLLYHWIMFIRHVGYTLGFQRSPRDIANVNEWKIMFDPYIITPDSQGQPMRQRRTYMDEINK